ncbi:GPCR fungal pheromone mating factor [Tylopilus felleus]
MYGATNIVFVVCISLGTLLVVIPLPRALASGNVGTIMLIVWTGLASLVQLTNAICWNGNVENSAPSWCDFSGCFLVVADLALVACAVSINRRLYMIVTLDPRREKKVFDMIVDILLCLMMPCASVALQYVVQQYRYYIFEDIGCFSGIGHVVLAFPLVWMLPLLVGVVSAVYALLTLRAYLRMNHRPTPGEAGMSSAWSRRLMAIGVISTMYGLIPTAISIALLATESRATPWPGWKALHSTNNVVVYVPKRDWQSSSIQVAGVELRRWTTVTLDFVVFVLLGLTTDVKKMYWAPFRGVIEQTFIGQTGYVIVSRS